MTSLADTLPPHIAAQVSPRWRANEAAYWTARERLRTDYDGQWVAFADGAVVASGPGAVEVLHAAAAAPGYPFVVQVGAEDEPCRMRRATFPYDAGYPGEPLPQLTAEFRVARGAAGLLLSRVIPDTGADATALPWGDCRALGFDPSRGQPARVGGVGGSSSATLAFPAWVLFDGQEYRCRLQADFAGDERILGRDVLNRVDILFRSPAGEVVINP